MKVICTGTGGFRQLTKDKIYEVIDQCRSCVSDKRMFRIVDDKGVPGWYYANRFRRVG